MKKTPTADQIRQTSESLQKMFQEIRQNAVYSPGTRQNLDLLEQALDAFLISAEEGKAGGSQLLQTLLKLNNISGIQAGIAVSLKVSHDPDITQISGMDVLESEKLDTVYDSNGHPKKLAVRLGSGGEGDVYLLEFQPDTAAKIYKKNRFPGAEQKEAIQRKLNALIRQKDAAVLNGENIAAFPEELLYDADHNFIGYTMPRVTAPVRIYEIARSDYHPLFPQLNYRRTLIIAYNLAEALYKLHSHDIVVGDLNSSNILVNQDGSIILTDCDSFDITDPDTGEHFPCTVGLREFLPPELQNGQKNRRFTKESDNFSLALHLFRLLMNNADPFGFACEGDELEDEFDEGAAIRNGESPYFRKISGKKLPPWAPGLDVLPPEMQELFRRVFCYTGETAEETISDRPTAWEWMGALLRFYRMSFRQCSKNPRHMYLSNLKECPFCAAENGPHPQAGNFPSVSVSLDNLPEPDRQYSIALIE